MKKLKRIKSLGIKLGKVNQSKISLKKNDLIWTIRFEPAKNTNTFKYFYSE